MVRFRDVLFKNKNFTLLWFAQVISNFGDRICQMALIALVWKKAPGSSLALAKVMSFTMIPVFVIGPVAGAWVDRWDKRDVMIISDLLRGFLALVLPALILLNNMPLVYLVIFLIYSIARFFIPSKMAIIPELVERDELLVANSLADSTKMLGNAIGLVAAGLLVNIRFIGAQGGFLIYSLSFFTSAALVGMIVKNHLLKHIKDDLIEATKALEESIRRSIFRELKEGLKVMWGRGDMKFIVGIFSFLMAGIGAIYCVIVTFIQQTFGNATRDLSILMLYLMVGLFFGTMFCGRFCQKFSKRKTIAVSFVTSGSAVILFTQAMKACSSLVLGGALAFMIGICVGPIMTSANTLAHETIPQNLRGRVFSALEAVMHLAFLALMFATGFLDRLIDKTWILAASGGVFILFGIAGFVAEAKRSRLLTS